MSKTTRRQNGYKWWLDYLALDYNVKYGYHVWNKSFVVDNCHRKPWRLFTDSKIHNDFSCIKDENRTSRQRAKQQLHKLTRLNNYDEFEFDHASCKEYVCVWYYYT